MYKAPCSNNAATDDSQDAIVHRAGGHEEAQASIINTKETDHVTWTSDPESLWDSDVFHDHTSSDTESISNVGDVDSQEERTEKTTSELKQELNTVLNGCATPPRLDWRDELGAQSSTKQPKAKDSGTGLAGNGSKDEHHSVSAVGRNLDAVESEHVKPSCRAVVLPHASIATVRSRADPTLIRNGANQEKQEIILEVQKVRRVEAQRQLGKYQDLHGIDNEVRVGAGQNKNYYAGLHRLPLPGLDDSICYSYSLGHIEECLRMRGEPEGSDGEQHPHPARTGMISLAR